MREQLAGGECVQADGGLDLAAAFTTCSMGGWGGGWHGHGLCGSNCMMDSGHIGLLLLWPLLLMKVWLSLLALPQ